MRIQFVFSNRERQPFVLTEAHLLPPNTVSATLWWTFPKRQQVTLRCAQDNKEVLRTLSLAGNGLLHNATGCSITSDAFQIFPELHGTTQMKMNATTLHLLDYITVIIDFELQQLVDIPLLEIQKLSEFGYGAEFRPPLFTRRHACRCCPPRFSHSPLHFPSCPFSVCYFALISVCAISWSKSDMKCRLDERQGTWFNIKKCQ